MRISDFEIIDHGIEHAQHFAPCGAARYAHVVTGVGDCQVWAIDDCLAQMAQAGWDTAGMEVRILEEVGEYSLTPNAYELHGSDSELCYHVSIRWSCDPK